MKWKCCFHFYIDLKYENILGRKITNPVNKLNMAETKTAAAAISFTFFILGWKSLWTILHSCSIAVFMISIIITRAIQKPRTAHSFIDIPYSKPNTDTTMADITWTLKFSSLVKQILNPFHAKTKDLIIFISLMLWGFLSYPFPPKSSTGSINKKLVQLINNRMYIPVNSNNNRHHKNYSQYCN